MIEGIENTRHGDCPRHSSDPLAKSVRVNRDLLGLPPQPCSVTWHDGDSITRNGTGMTWTRIDGEWRCNDGSCEPKTDDHASRTLDYYGAGILVTVTRAEVDAANYLVRHGDDREAVRRIAEAR